MSTLLPATGLVLTRPLHDFVRWLAELESLIANLQTKLARYVPMVRELCRVAGELTLIDDLTSAFIANGLREAIRHHDDGPIFDWLAETFSYQGVADSVATSYLEEHGGASFGQIERSLARKPACSKLGSYWQFNDCGYRKAERTCNEPELVRRCPLPRLDLRNGNLNRVSYSLWLFMRDVSEGDFVSWLDARLAEADQGKRDRGSRLALAVLEPLSHVYGVSFKMVSMALSSLLLAGDSDRERWVTAGANQIVVDTLVHNWLHRTGCLKRMRSEHSYGPRCYAPNGCADIVRTLSRQIDARRFDARFQRTFPRFVQHAIWRFCSQQGFNQCNGNQINDRERCDQTDCLLYANCDRRVLQPAPKPDLKT